MIGNEFPLNEVDWILTVFTSIRSRTFIASYLQGACKNCVIDDDGKITILCKDHGLPAGQVRIKLDAFIPDELFEGGKRKVVTPDPVNIWLVEGKGDAEGDIAEVEVEAVLPLIKGEKGDKGDTPTWNDFSDADKEQMSLHFAEEAKQALFDDLFKQAGGEFAEIDHTHDEEGVSKPYCLNGIWLTYGEALAVYDAGPIDNVSAALKYCGAKIRTNLPPRIASCTTAISASYQINLEKFIDASDIEVLNLTVTRPYSKNQYGETVYAICPYFSAGANTVTFQAPKLRKIMGVVDVGRYNAYDNNKLIGNCPELVEFRFKWLSHDVSFAGVPKMSPSSLRYIIQNKRNIETSLGTITLHPDTYAKILEAEESGNTDSEWAGILDLAASKNITLASA